MYVVIVNTGVNPIKKASKFTPLILNLSLSAGGSLVVASNDDPSFMGWSLRVKDDEIGQLSSPSFAPSLASWHSSLIRNQEICEIMMIEEGW